MKTLKSIPKFESEIDERRFWEMNDASDYFDLNKAIRLTALSLKPHYSNMKSQARTFGKRR